MKSFALTVLGACIALSGTGQQILSGDTVCQELRFPLTEADTKKPFFYFNDEWIPGARLEMIAPEEILKTEIKDDKYGNRSLFFTVEPEVFNRLMAEAREEDRNVWPDRNPICEFPGGNGKLKEWINENLRIPESVTGSTRVIVKVRIMPDGSVTEANVFKPSNNEEANEEALRLVNSLPKFRVEYFTPKRVPLHYYIPITFNEPGKLKIR